MNEEMRKTFAELFKIMEDARKEQLRQMVAAFPKMPNIAQQFSDLLK